MKKKKENKIKVNLDLERRYALLSVLPENGNRVTMRLLRRIAEKIEPTSEETKQFNIVYQEKNRVTYNLEGKKKKSFSLDIDEYQIVMDKLRELDNTSKLNIVQFKLVEYLDSFCDKGK